ncbi:hypothetical protein CYJ66_03590 [Gardnerella vaginalis]|nr:hypothetical protein CYJ66_03590 [Gardnerella vaginalis]PKZ55964.1 hypothetical protein CYJ64_03590 [Gardnerella vaginalis]
MLTTRDCIVDEKSSQTAAMIVEKKARMATITIEINLRELSKI